MTRAPTRATARRGRVLRWMDRWIEPLLIFLAASTIPLIIIGTGDPSEGDLRFVVGATWFIWGAFTANFVLRLAVADRRERTTETKRLAWDLALILGQPLASLGERKAFPGLALVSLVPIAARALRQGHALRRTGYKLRTDPIRAVAFVVPYVWLLSASLIWRFERDTGTVDSVGDSLWWGIVTLATVGYGDISPKTTAGRVVGVMVMLVGIAMFSVVTAKLAERLLAHRARLGRTEVQEENHTLIVGWSPMLVTIVEQLVLANRNR
jgi:voltage-gated potassium channel